MKGKSVLCILAKLCGIANEEGDRRVLCCLWNEEGHSMSVEVDLERDEI